MPSMCSRTRRTAWRESPLRDQPHQLAVLRVRVGEHLVGVSDQRDQLAHPPLHLGHLPHEPWRVGRLGEPDVEADVAAAVGLEVVAGVGHPLDQVVELPEVLGLRALAGEQHRPGLHRHPVVEDRPGRIAQDVARRRCRPRRAVAARRRTCRRCAPAGRPGARSGRASSAPRAGSSGRCRARRRACAPREASTPGASRPTRIAVPSRSTVSSNVVGGRTGMKTASRAGSRAMRQRYRAPARVAPE